ncbi:MAG: M81 family metallopeptidase [Caulobacterales bacterium]|nr:M81 family metallopeptidase [Caulobacterales bacterium]
MFGVFRRCVVRLGLVLGLTSCAALDVESKRAEAPLRFAVARFQHETCTFCPGGDVTVEDWERASAPHRGDEVLTAGPYVRGFVRAARDYQGVELIGLQSPHRVFGGSSRSWNTEETFDYFVTAMLDDMREAGPVDGVYLALHGAMAVRGVPRPEAEVARRFREALGPDAPIVASFDLHGNEDEAFLRWADMSFVTKRYPHYDAGLQGERAARALVRMARGTYKPTTATRKPGVITPTVLQWTGQSPSMDIMERARRWEARQPDAFVSVFLGFPWSDVPDVGAAVQVMTNEDQALAETIADDMSDYIWRVREGLFDEALLQPDAAVARAAAALAEGAAPVVLADYSDRSGDATFILKEIIDQKLPRVLYGTLRDEHAVEALAGAAPGDRFERAVGGFAGPSSGEPVRIAGEVLYVGEGLGFDRVGVIGFGDGAAVILTPALRQVTTPDQLAFGPLDPAAFDVFVVKSRVHFRRGFDETGFAPSIFIVDAPGPFVGTVHLDALDYENVTLTDHHPYGTPPDRSR